MRLGDVVDISSGENLKRSEYDSRGKYPVLGANGKIGYTNKYLLDEKIIFTGRVGTLGNIFISSTKAWLSDNTLIIKPTNSHFHYLYYFLKNTDLQGLNVGSTQPLIRQSDLKETAILLPPLPEQKAIAEVLSSLDDKIDLLHRQNKTLEDMAQTLFRKWFVEEEDEGWEKKSLEQTVSISIGRTPPRKEFQWFSRSQENWKWISIKDMAKNGIYLFQTSEYLTKEAVAKFNIPIIPKDTVVLSFKMTVGRVKITTENMLSNEAIANFKVKPETPYSKEYLYFYLKTFKFDSLGSTSSIVTSINTAMIKGFLIPIPNKELTEKFKSVSNSLFEKIYYNQCQIRTLENLRDTLLPQLMNRAARVRNFHS